MQSTDISVYQMAVADDGTAVDEDVPGRALWPEHQTGDGVENVRQIVSGPHHDVRPQPRL